MMRNILFTLTILLLGYYGQAQTVRSFCVEVSVTGSTLSWPAVPNAARYYVYRKALTDADFPQFPRTTVTSGTSYTDSQLGAGSKYEYQVMAADAASQVIATGNVYAGKDVAATHYYGHCILLIDSTYRQPLALHLDTLEADIRYDGFTVQRYLVGRSTVVTDIRDSLAALYATRPAGAEFYVFVIGHVPVPYSGEIAPDGHIPDHEGAWPADVYYADYDGTWTDNTVDTGQRDPADLPTRTENYNVPGDLKWDQNTLPSNVEARLGRVDMVKLPIFPQSDTVLLARYLMRNHAFRHTKINPVDSALVRDDFQACCHSYLSPFGAHAWRNYTAFFGQGRVKEMTQVDSFLDSLELRGYRAVFGAGGGMYDYISGIGYTSAFVNKHPKAVFWAMMGSYKGDWDSENNILRGALAADGWALTNQWSGRPYWAMHHMGLGLPIGLSAQLSQNADQNVYGFDYGHRMVHVALLGDPTLRLHYVVPPTLSYTGMSYTAGSPTATVTLNNASLNLNGADGVYWYRNNRYTGKYEYQGTVNPNNLSFPCAAGVADHLGGDILLRAYRTQTTGSGTYVNLSEGILIETTCQGAVPTARSAAGTLSARIYPNPAGPVLHIELEQSAPATLQLSDMQGRIVGQHTLGGGHEYTLTHGLPAGVYIALISQQGQSYFSKIVVAE